MPQEKISIGFVSSTPAGTDYQWFGPDKFNQNFPGDNTIINAKPGTYKFTAKDTLGCSISDSVIVPEKLTENISKVFSDSCSETNFNVTIEIKSIKDGFISRAIIPPPLDVVKSYKELHFKNCCTSLTDNT